MLNTEPWAAGLAGLKQELERLQTFAAALHKSSAKVGWAYVVTDWSADFFGIRRACQSRWECRRPAVPQLLQTAPTSCQSRVTYAS